MERTDPETSIARRFASVETVGRITVVTLNRPEVMNALHRAAHEELGEIFDAFAADPDQWVAILTGAGPRAFCTGYDLKALAAGETEGWGPGGFGGLARRFDCDKPIIAAVNGLALGGGFELALACDLVVAARGARFGLPECRAGLIPASGGLQRLTTQVGLKRAMAMIMTGDAITAEEAERFGLVNEVVEDGAVLEAAMDWARRVCRSSPLAVRAAKDTVAALMDPVEQSLSRQDERTAVRRLRASEDVREGPRAFAEKRPPVWKGY
ncbi:enoyl-CoA hydratase-related protein [Acuticoccus sediminis]|uniref:enoyl-CoA hydratase-related protein n=1 Tax=Acuticoccus sediminis TaxID=2184697 RepID=UPI003CC81770